MDIIKQVLKIFAMLIFMVVVTIALCLPMIAGRCFYILIPKRIASAKRFLLGGGEFAGWLWCKMAIGAINFVSGVRWQIEGEENIPKEKSCIIISNHCSWFDIPAVFRAMINTGVVVRFFIKRVLILLPLLGQAAWGIYCPFMRRYGRKYLEKYPEKAGLDIIETKRSCEVFRGRQVYLLNYLEGTRFSKEKKDKQKSPYRNLLNPRAGGVANAILAMEGQVQNILDFTISYPNGRPTFMTFLSGREFIARVQIEVLELPEVGSGDYANDPVARKKYQSWINSIWRKKDNKFGEDVMRYAA